MAMTTPGRAPLVALALLVLAGCFGCGPSEPTGKDAPGEPAPTFNREIAPIVFDNCAVCHRPGESAPFSLLGYREVEKRARQVMEVTASRFMPPWLPEAGEHGFLGERRLTDLEVATIRRWVEHGAVEGDPADLPPLPEWTEGWQLGEPDLVVTMAEPYTLAAEAVDVFRNFVIPLPVSGTRYVKAVELRPGNKKIVHHAVMQIDETPSSRRLDEREPGPGFDGMEMGHSLPPDGHFLGWTPGKAPFAGTEGLAWRLREGTDLVLQLHMLPTGKPEPIRPAVGLYFADEPPALRPTVITLSYEAIDIPAGERDYVIEDRFRLPVDVELLSVYPHAHYLGKEIDGFAVLPDGSEVKLIHISDWDFNWQDEYRYAEPVALPAGATLTMRYTYDNSRDNVRNPNDPPRRVRSGNQSSDEMGTMTLQVLARGDRERAALEEAKARDWLRDYPDSWNEHNNLGNALLAQDRHGEAIEHYRRALRLQPALGDARYNLGLALTSIGRRDEAIEEFRRVLRDEPGFARAHINLGNALLARGERDPALDHLRRAVELQPALEGGHYNLGIALAAAGELDEAIAHYRRAIEIEPGFAMAHNNLGTALHSQGRVEQAVVHYGRALELEPTIAEARNNLGLALLEGGRPEEAAGHFRRALETDPDFAVAHRNLGDALRALGKLDEAIAHYRRALALDPRDVEARKGLENLLSDRLR